MCFQQDLFVVQKYYISNTRQTLPARKSMILLKNGADLRGRTVAFFLPLFVRSSAKNATPRRVAAVQTHGGGMVAVARNTLL